MQLHHLRKSLFDKAALAAAALTGLLFFAGAPGAQAADRDDGHRRIVIVERGFSEGRGGYYTRQADRWGDERREAFERRYTPVYRNDWDRDRDDHRYHRDFDRDRR